MVAAENLHPSDSLELTRVLSNGSALASKISIRDGVVHTIRILAVPDAIGKCSSSIESCPDWRLYFTVSTDDLCDEPSLYQLPLAKGWVFDSWLDNPDPYTTEFRVLTSLPDANIDAKARESWSQRSYQVTVTQEGVTVSLVTGDD